MQDTDSLNVWYGLHLVGTVWRNVRGLIGFSYSKEWLSLPKSFRISCKLPLRTGDFLPEEQLAHRFFVNLLPEGSVRAQTVRDLKIPDTEFDLLRAIGGECAGALSLLPVDLYPSIDYRYAEINDDALYQLVGRKGIFYSDSSTLDRPRLSLPGAQDKCPVLFEKGSYWMPKGESPSNYILKFELAQYRNLPVYETYTTALAKAVGLPVVNVRLARIKDKSYALVQRYDRVYDSFGRIQRLHQEDFCQALGFGHEKKYQDGGGPSFADCYQLIRDVSSDPAHDLQYLLRWQIFNVLAGNSDGHAKNLSLLYFENGDIRLAPFYDLICTRAIKRINTNLAMQVAGQRNPNLITESIWENFGTDCSIRPSFVLKQVNEMANSLLDNLKLVRQQFEKDYGITESLQRVDQIIIKQCKRFVKTYQ